MGMSKICLNLIEWLRQMKNGGDKRIRTADPLLAKQVLYQLSYIPKYIYKK
jgi:hypothetical protein